MRRFKEIIGRESTWAALIIMFAVVNIFVRSVNHINIGDELRYYYKFDLKPGQTYFNFSHLEPVKTIEDVVDSQINHYRCVNGRIPVHFIEQLISAKQIFIPYFIINALLFGALIVMFIKLTLPKGKRYNALAILVITMGFMYLFPNPGRLWVSINLSLNYLLPSLLTLCTIYILGLVREGRLENVGWLKIAGLYLLGFFTGWSNEAFSFPLSGALFLYYVFHIKKFDYYSRSLVIPLWIGAVAMVLSPGNWIRASKATDIVPGFLDVLLSIKIIWILIAVGVICAVFNRKGIYNFIKRNYVLFIALLLAVGMGVMAHTGARSFTAIELFAYLLITRAASPLIRPTRGVLRVIFIIIMCLFVLHQSLVTREHIRHYRAISKAVDDYRTSRYGTVRYDYQESPALLAPFVYSQIPTLGGAKYEWSLLGVSVCGTQKPFIALSPEQYDNIDTINYASPGSSPLYPFTQLGNGYVAPAGCVKSGSYAVTTDDGRQLTIYCRKFYSPSGRVFSALVPIVDELKIVRITPIKK